MNKNYTMKAVIVYIVLFAIAGLSLVTCLGLIFR